MRVLQRVRVSAEGFNRARLTDSLTSAGIAVEDFAVINGRKFAFTVTKKDMRKTFAILDEMCYTYSAEVFAGAGGAAKRLLRRLGLIAGILLFSVPLMLSRSYVWRLEISGNEQVPDKVIENVLSEKGIAVGKKLTAFDSEELSAAVRSVDGISLASVVKRGTTVSVEVFEGERTSDKLAYSDTDILSGFDATVTSVITREGTALVEVGQHVFEGTPLIGAYRAPLEGEEPIHTRASGIVYGKVARTYSTTVACERYERTAEKTERRTRLEIFGLTIGKKPKLGEGCTAVESESKLNAFLPIKVKTTRITRYTTHKVTQPIEKLAQDAEDEIMLGFISKYTPCGYESSRSVTDLGGGIYRVNVFVEGEIVIGGA